jgi:hypothetical protein
MSMGGSRRRRFLGDEAFVALFFSLDREFVWRLLILPEIGTDVRDGAIFPPDPYPKYANVKHAGKGAHQFA